MVSIVAFVEVLVLNRRSLDDVAKLRRSQEKQTASTIYLYLSKSGGGVSGLMEATLGHEQPLARGTRQPSYPPF